VNKLVQMCKVAFTFWKPT